MCKLHYLAALLFLTTQTAWSQPIITYFDPSSRMAIGNHIKILKDSSQQLTIQDVVSDHYQQKFSLSSQTIPSFGFTSSSIWLKIRVQNSTAGKIYLLIDYPKIQKIEFYYHDSNGHLKTKSAGFYSPYRLRDLPGGSYYFELPSIDKEVNTFYLKVQSDDQIILPLIIESYKSYVHAYSAKAITNGIFIGIFFITIIVNLLLYIAIKKVFYVYHLLRIIALLFIFDILIYQNLFHYVFPDNPDVNRFYATYASLTLIAEISFCRSFLKTRWSNLMKHKILGYIILACLLPVFFDILRLNTLSNIIFSALAILAIPLLISTGYSAYRAKFRGALYYLLGSGTFLALAFTYLLIVNNIIPAFFGFSELLIIGGMLDVLIISIGFAYRIKFLRDQKEKATKHTLQIIKENNETLEKKVIARTREIEIQSRAIKIQNEELLTQHETIKEQNIILESQNKELEDAKKTIDDQNLQLKKYNEDLEREINLRTGELQKTNDELIRHYHQLEQFSFITAHNLRAPVARLLGLTSLLNDRYRKDVDEKEVKEKILNTSKQLDEIIHDINGILDIRKGTKKNFEEVNLQEQVDHVKLLLSDEIQNSKASIQTCFKEVKTITSLPAYIESIFFNLLSNSIKYRAEERDPIIEICSSSDQGIIKITFKDNGIGLDVKRFREKIFGIYQRFNLNVEGKGLGLHLVKSQVEALGGTIFIASEVDKGAEFTLLFPEH